MKECLPVYHDHYWLLYTNDCVHHKSVHNGALHNKSAPLEQKINVYGKKPKVCKYDVFSTLLGQTNWKG